MCLHLLTLRQNGIFLYFRDVGNTVTRCIGKEAFEIHRQRFDIT